MNYGSLGSASHRRFTIVFLGVCCKKSDFFKAISSPGAHTDSRMTMTKAERIHSLVTFHLDNRKKNKKPNPGQILLRNWTSATPPDRYQGVQLDHHWRQVPPLSSPSRQLAAEISPRWRSLCGVLRHVVRCLWCIAAHSTATIVPAPPPLHLHRHRLQCGSDRRPTKMLTRALVRASRALPGILTRAHATYEGAACRRKALRST